MMLLEPFTGCMQDPDVEQAGHRRWISHCQVFGYVASPEALAMNHHSNIFDRDRFRPCVREPVNIVGEGQLGSEAVFGVVIARNEEDGDAVVPQARHAAEEGAPCAEVLQVAVKDVAC